MLLKYSNLFNITVTEKIQGHIEASKTDSVIEEVVSLMTFHYVLLHVYLLFKPRMIMMCY